MTDDQAEPDGIEAELNPNGAASAKQAEQDHDGIIRANGFVHIRSALNTAANGVLELNVPIIDAAIAYLEKARSGKNVQAHGAPAATTDAMDVELATWRVLRTARIELDEVVAKAQLRADLRAGGTSLPRGRRGR